MVSPHWGSVHPGIFTGSTELSTTAPAIPITHTCGIYSSSTPYRKSLIAASTDGTTYESYLTISLRI